MAEDMPDLVQSQEKKATHEIKSINAINQTALGLCTALMCVLDYKGFRMVAYASMPLDEQVGTRARGCLVKARHRPIRFIPQRTLVLDLAAESPRIEPNALDFLKPVGAALNLKEHEVTLGGGQSVQTSIASNIEVRVQK